MRLDIPTLAFVTSLVFAAQTLAFFVQYKVNRAYKGPEWWLLGAICQALGFFLMLALSIPSIWLLAALANPLVISGQLLLYRGVGQFLGKVESARRPLALFAAFTLAYLACIFVIDSILGRTVVVYGSSALVSMLIARELYRRKKASFSASATFAGAVFFAYACLQVAMTAITIALPPLASYSELGREPLRALSFLIPIIGSTLWSFALIIMVNQRLNAENLEEREKLRLVFNLSPDAQLITRMGDDVVMDVNEAFLAITGSDRAQIVGWRMEEAQFWDRSEDLRAFKDELLAKAAVAEKEYQFRRKDGGRLTGMISARIIRIQDQPHRVSVIQDVTERNRAGEEIRRLLAEKELILKEVHHRIKNNMATIYSLLSLQAGSMKDSRAAAAFEDTKNRIKSMMMLYETLYVSSNFASLSVGLYLPPLIDEILSNFPEAEQVRVEKRIDDFFLDVKRLQPLGIIVNELLTNIMKHAFSAGDDKRIEVSALQRDGQVTIIVEDNGKGLPASIDLQNPTGFGLLLASGLAAQLDGRLRLERGMGTRVVLEFEL